MDNSEENMHVDTGAGLNQRVNKYLIGCFGVEYRRIFLRVVLYFDELARFIIQLNLFQPFSTFFSNLKENYKRDRMSARTVLYNNKLYNNQLYSFRALFVQ